MSNTQAEGPTTQEQKDAIEQLSDLRKSLHVVKDQAEALRNAPYMKVCGRELSLLITEVQSARHWGGECLAHFPTGYRVTDNPNDPGSESKGSE